MGKLDGKVAVVTGGAQGIGGATARRLAAEGARVLIADLDADTAKRNVATIAAAGGTAASVVTDVAKHDDLRAMVARAVELWGRLDVLVNNAYGGHAGSRGSALEVTEEGWDHGMAVMVKALFLAAKYAVPEMAKVGGGAIVNLSSVHALAQAPGRLVYEVGKTAVIGATRQMACDFGPLGIRVNAVCPGLIMTERMQARRLATNPEGMRFVEQQYPLRRTGTPDDIANAIAFLSSDEASFVTGHALVVDGGLTIQLQEDLTVRLAEWAREHPDVKIG
jgi:NAD(P)-dependent dehydrogenase (short-subunit alcohol dehydrogenase family)